METVTSVESLATVSSGMEEKLQQNETLGSDVPLEQIFGPRRDSLYIVIPITVVYCIIFLTGLIGNISTCIVIARNKSMHTATNYYLFSLAISDLLLLISGLPQEMYSIWSRYPYVFGYTFCVLRGLCSETSANATVLTITAFTVERYVAICHPFLSHTLAKLSRIVKLILLIWIIAVCFAVPQAVQFGTMPMMEGKSESIMCHVINPIIEHSFEVSTFLFFLAPMTLITVLYVLIGVRLRSSTNMMKKEIGDCSANFGSRMSCTIPKMGTRHQNSKASRRVLKMLVAVVVAFFICWAPFHAQRLFAIYVTPSSDGSDDHYLKIYEIMTYVSGILYYISTTINPLLYNIMSNKFREAFKETFTRCFHLGRTGRTERSYSVLSRSAQRGPDSTDSTGKEDPSIHTHMSLIQKNSMETAVVSCGPGYRPHDKRQLEKNSSDGDKIRWPKDRSDIRLSVVPKHNYENIQPGTKLVAVHVHNVPQRKFGSKFLQLFHCIAKRTLDDGKKLTTYYSSPAKEQHTALELERTTNDKNETFSLTSGEISDSSLRDIENQALEDELNTYMLEIKRCELR